MDWAMAMLVFPQAGQPRSSRKYRPRYLIPPPAHRFAAPYISAMHIPLFPADEGMEDLIEVWSMLAAMAGIAIGILLSSVVP